MLAPLIQQRIEEFLRANPIHPLIVIYGPTASGKTGMSLDIATTYHGEIVSTDSRQIYRGLDIGTGKITKEEMGNIPHHMLDVIDPSEAFSVGKYREMALPIIERIWERGNIPILCGGTGLYIDSLIFRRSYANAPDTVRRKELEAIVKSEGKQVLWDMLYRLDPAYAESLHPNNYHYVMRGIEVFESTGSSKSLIQNDLELHFPTLFLTPYSESAYIPEISQARTKEERKKNKLKIPQERIQLYETIDRRIDEMFYNGLIEEVEYLKQMYGELCPGLQTIGYTEVCDYLSGTISREVCIEQVKQHNRNYAKRQLTWNKKYSTI